MFSAQPSWDRTDPEVAVNSSLVLTCSVTKSNPAAVVYLTKSSYGFTDTIAENGELMQPFSDTGRYAVTHNYADEVTTLTLTYTGEYQYLDLNHQQCLWDKLLYGESLQNKLMIFYLENVLSIMAFKMRVVGFYCLGILLSGMLNQFLSWNTLQVKVQSAPHTQNH